MKYLPLLAAIVLSGCATSLSPQGSMVKRATKEEVRGYKFLGNVTKSNSMAGVLAKQGFESALNAAMNEAAKRGGTHIVVDPTSEPYYWATSQVVRAEIYKAP